MAKGHCNCGEVTFELDLNPTDIFICHCSICRRSTGSNGMAVVVVDNNKFRWLQGKHAISTWKKPDADWQTWFCHQCGSPLPGHNDEHRMFIPAALISEGGDALTVRHHIWTDSKAKWDKIGDDGQQHSNEFKG